MKRVLFILSLLLPSVAHATPSISSISGSAIYGSTLTFAGSSFGTKPIRQKQTLYANFKSDANPSTWSFITSWSDPANFQYKTTDCGEGGGCLGESSSFVGSSKITAAIDHGHLNYGDKFSVSWMWKSNAIFSGAANIKTFRWWGTIGTKNNVYGGQPGCSNCAVGAGSFLQYVENLLDGLAPSTGIDRFYTDFIEPNDSTYEQIDMLFQINSSGNAQDGHLTLVKNGTGEIDSSTWRSNTTLDTNANGIYSLFYPVHLVVASNVFPAGSYARYDNIMADTSWCAAWVTTNATYAAAGTKYWLPIISWSDTSIQVAWANDKFANGTTVYGYARANDGTVNANGKALTVAGSSGVPAPTVTGISISSGPSSGLTATDITGTGFVQGCSVKIGTISASAINISFNSSTSLSITTPTHSTGTFDVSVINPDGQSGVLASTFTFYAPPTITSINTSIGPAPGNISDVVNGAATFRPNFTVKFGTVPATGLTIYASSITLTVPAHSSGTVDVSLLDNFGQVSTLTSTFTYSAQPVVTSVIPATGYTTNSGGIISAIGSNFISGDTIKIGTTTAPASGVVVTTSISGTIPSLPVGTYDVSVSDIWGQTGTLSNAYTVAAPPSPPTPYTIAFPWISR